MEHLKKSEFSNFLSSLEITNECNCSYAQDDCAVICKVDKNGEMYSSEIIVIDRTEYALTDKQRQEIINDVTADMYEDSEPFDYNDKQNALSLIYS